MNLNTIEPKNESEDLLLSITKNCEALVEQTHRRAEETLEFKKTKSREIFHFKPPIPIQGNWMIGLPSLEVYNSVFNTTEDNNKFDLYAGPLYTELSYTTLKDKIAEVLRFSDIYPEDLEDELHGPDIFEIFTKLSIEKTQTNGYYIFFKRYLHPPIRAFKVVSEFQLD